MTLEFYPARRHAGQPPTAPLGGGFSPARGRGLPFAPCDDCRTQHHVPVSDMAPSRRPQ
jgi:hypothetical protein